MDKKRIALLVLRWTARVFGSLVLVLILAIAIGEGPPNPLHQPWKVNIELLAMLAICVGFVVAWKWEGLGGGLLVGGMLVFSFLEGRFMGGIAWGWLLPGLAFLLCRLMDPPAGHPSSRPAC